VTSDGGIQIGNNFCAFTLFLRLLTSVSLQLITKKEGVNQQRFRSSEQLNSHYSKLTTNINQTNLLD